MKKLVFTILFLTFFFTLSAQIGFQKHEISLGYRADSNSDRFVPVDIDGDNDLDVYFTSIYNYQQDTECYSGLLEKNDSFNGFLKAKCVGILQDGDSSENIHAEDLDGDGDMDLIDTNSYYSGFNSSPSVIGEELRWYENIDGEGSFSEKKIINPNLNLQVSRIRTIDIDNDGNMDIVTAGSGLRWYENVDNFETIQEAKVISGSGFYDFLRIVDIDNDGDMDVIASVTYESGKIELFRNLDGNGDFGKSEIIYSIETQYDSRLLPFILNDVDFDGDTDVIFLDRANDEIAWCKNTNGLGNFSDKINIPIEAEGLYRIYNGDLDGDGDDDLITESFNDISWFEKLDEDENFGIKQSIVDNHSANFNYDHDGNIAIADLNNDGRIDLMYKHSYDYNGNSYVAWLENKGLGKNEIRGFIRLDANLDGCDITDIPSSNIGISASSGTTFSMNNGFYQMFLDYGQFNVKPDFNLPDYFTLTPESRVVNFNDLGNIEIVDFCISANQTVNDLNVVVIPKSEVRPGFNTSYALVVNNRGTAQTSGEVSLEFNPNLTFLAASEIPKNQSSNSLEFTIQNLKPFESKIIDLSFNLAAPPAINIGDSLRLNATLSPVVSDFSEEDNTFNLEQIVIGSYDPNDITVLEGSSITPEQAEGYLNYVIRFQNTGTASAINVRVNHELDDKLDWSTFIPNTSSHENVINIKNDKEVEFWFENINLPDSTSNEPSSHGYISFKIKPKTGIQTWDFINATANIYFDFNPPITTNTATTQVQGEIFPFESSITNVRDIKCGGSYLKGAVSFEVNGGNPPYLIELSNENYGVIRTTSSERSFDNLSGGHYNVKVSDSNGNETIHKITILENPRLYSNFNDRVVTDVSCAGGSNGSIEITAHGGVPPYLFQIAGEEYSTSNIFMGLSAKQYRIRIKDSVGCINTSYVTVGTTIDNSVNCNDYDDDGIGNENDNCPNTANPLQEDLNNNGIGDVCENGEPLVANAILISHISCNGSNDGIIQVEALGGKMPYTYELLDESYNVLSSQTSNIFSNLGQGDYITRVVDDTLEESYGNTTIITITEPQKIQLTTTTKDVSCSGTDDGSIRIDVTGGAEPYQYRINNGPFQDSNYFKELTEGLYSIEVFDRNGCSALDIVELVKSESQTGDCGVFNLPSTNFVVQTTGESCLSSNNGNISITATENLNYKATLYGVSTITKEFTDSVTFEELEADQYEVCITVSTHPEYEKCFTVQISQPEALSVNSKIDTSSKSVSLKMKGGAKYIITLNDAIYNTDESEITLPLSQAENSISIKTNKDCQGVYKDTLLLNSGVSVYPNPVKNGKVTVLIIDSVDGIAKLTLFDNTMKLVKTMDQKLTKGTVTLDMDGLSSGLYSLQIETKTGAYTRKILKD
ncbi:FG-GAP-like repeat-containing protein [uncultured Zobellia sp.]|uniref:DUF7619 domain-containing protein n=1 Tax=uncultured Zobellia sp. TaxID=255433 RepID=UPI002595C568|nr:FG-GAP-like repeat-containing protein [uncultured Zobellia sp.]